MGIGRIFLGVAVIIIGIVIWFSMFSDALDIFIKSPQKRYEFREMLEKVKLIYFLVIIVIGICLILWGSQT